MARSVWRRVGMARKQRVQKTNAMRELERGGVAYEAIEFEEPDPTGVSDLGVRIANMLGYDPAQGFKTLVCVTPAGGHVVCCGRSCTCGTSNPRPAMYAAAARPWA